MAQRDTYKYHIKQGNRILHRGITNDLDRRYNEHRQTFGGNITISKVGRAVSRETALEWERNGGKR